MAVPTTREDFKLYCLRKLGAPVLKINVDDDQVEDRIDEALKFYYDYHFDGSEKIYYKHQITANTIANKYITLPENIIGAVNLFDIGGIYSSATSDMFSIQYQIALNDLYTLTSQSMIPYYMTMQHLELIHQLLVGKKPIRYNRHVNKLYVDMNWANVVEGNWLVVEAYQIVDPETYPDVWGDRWLQRYCAALIKKQWGTHLTKFTNMQLTGGTVFNGQKIYDDAVQEIHDLEESMIMDYSLPVVDIIG